MKTESGRSDFLWIRNENYMRNKIMYAYGEVTNVDIQLHALRIGVLKLQFLKSRA